MKGNRFGSEGGLWRQICGRARSKYVLIHPGSMATPPEEEFSQYLSPVKLGPAQIRTLWKVIEKLFDVPEGWQQVSLDSWIQGQKASGAYREKVKSHDLESFINNLNLKGLLDDVTICFDQLLKRATSEATRKRFLQLHITQQGSPEVSITGDPAWHASATKSMVTFFENESSHSRRSRALLVPAGMAFGLALGGAIAIPTGWLLGTVLGIMFALLGGLFMNGAVTRFVHDSRIYVDERSGKPSVLYEWGSQITTGVIAGGILLLLGWATGHL